ncbi:metal-binding protein [Cyanosarcina cf. burmensis CCALA 770]|nr:metal-binding protein [Cyanosarcina cf. burmensis CCALA 770]
MTKHALFVCKSCLYSPHQREYMGKRGGWYLLDRLLSHSESWQLRASFVIQPVECLSACKRPCAVALAAPNKTTLMFGDLPPLESAAAVLQLASQYYNSTDGIVTRQERPVFNVDYFENSFGRLRVSYGAPFTVQGTISWEF